MTEGLWAAIIGVAGTLLGTFLGWVLNSWSNSGKLKVSTVDTQISFEKQDSIGSICRCDFDESKCFILETKIDIYNNSSNTKIMKDIKILFLDKSKKVLKRIVPYDEDFTTFNRVYEYQKVCPLNIKAFTITEKRFKWYAWKHEESYDYLIDTKSIILAYTNESGKTKKVALKNLDGSDLFKQKLEEQNNG
ncbi:MAG: hypothetical protein K2M47_02910 [Clostridiales bacterium]|nr:hypothetical protein [Clostridiales bacterium]